MGGGIDRTHELCVEAAGRRLRERARAPADVRNPGREARPGPPPRAARAAAAGAALARLGALCRRAERGPRRLARAVAHLRCEYESRAALGWLVGWLVGWWDFDQGRSCTCHVLAEQDPPGDQVLGRDPCRAYRAGTFPDELSSGAFPDGRHKWLPTARSLDRLH